MDSPFFQALDRERRLREEAYLGVPHDICGVPCREITPRLLAILFRLRTPYLTGGEVLPEDTLLFLWAVHRDNPMRAEKSTLLRRSKRDQFLKSARKIDFTSAEIEIDQWLEDTFMDAPEGKPSRPYVCSIAWLEYSMSTKPFLWDRDRTLETPLRVIYQLLRCRAIDNGHEVTNRISGAVLQRAINDVNTPEEMAKRALEHAEKVRKFQERIARENEQSEETGGNN